MGMQLVKKDPAEDNPKNKKQKKKRFRFIQFIVLAALVLVLLFCAGSYFLFRVDSITYLGGNHYDAETLNRYIFGTDSPNALYYVLFGKKNQNITFVEKYDVDVEWPNKMTVTVYEKSITGYINYMGSYMYFDREGIVVESTSQRYEGVPEVSGLSFRSIVLKEKLEVGSDAIFNRILEMTQAFDKYELEIHRIFFNASQEVTLYMGDVKVLLGNAEDCTDKLFVLKQTADKLTGLKGTLDLADYDGTASSIIFKNEG